MIIDKVLTVARNFFGTERVFYGSAAQLNVIFTDVDIQAAGYIVYSYLIEDGEEQNGYERANVVLFFAKLCDFDFNGIEVLTNQKELQQLGMDFIIKLRKSFNIDSIRWQFGAGDFAENLSWVALRVSVEELKTYCNKKIL